MTPIGIRQNNPGNIRATPDSYRSYGSPEDGIAATMQNLIAYNDKHGINTINGMVNRWAPAAVGNNVGAYVNDVAQTAGMHPDQPYNVRDPQTLVNLATAITKHENGSVPYSPEQFNTAANMALGGDVTRSTQSLVAPPQMQAASITPTGLPPGFQLDAQPQAAQGLPPGFQLDGLQSFQPTTSDRLQQVAQGGTFGLSDEIGSGLAATKMAMDKGRLSDWNEDYTTGVTGLRQDMNTYQQQRPLETMGLQFVGGLPAALASGSALANGLRGSNFATRALASGAAGAASGGAYGFGTGEGDGRLQSAGQGALVGGVLGAALPFAPAAGNAVATTTAKGVQTGARGVMARSPEILQDTADAMKKNAGGMFNQMRDIGAVINEAKTSDLLSNIDAAVKSKQFIPELNPKTLAIVNHIKEAASEGTLGINDLDQYRRLLSRVGNSEDGVSAGTVRNAIDSTVNSITENDLASGGREAVDLLNQARPAYSKAMKFKEVTDLVTKADGDPNRIKAAFQRFTANDENKKGFSLAEWDALKKAARTGIGENILKAFGKFGVDFSNSGTGNTVLPTLMAMGKVGGAALIPGGLPAVAAATLARQSQKFIARGKVENALRVIEGR